MFSALSYFRDFPVRILILQFIFENIDAKLFSNLYNEFKIMKCLCRLKWREVSMADAVEVYRRMMKSGRFASMRKKNGKKITMDIANQCC